MYYCIQCTEYTSHWSIWFKKILFGPLLQHVFAYCETFFGWRLMETETGGEEVSGNSIYAASWYLRICTSPQYVAYEVVQYN